MQAEKSDKTPKTEPVTGDIQAITRMIRHEYRQLRNRDIIIDVALLSATPYRDVLELLLRILRVKSLRWRENNKLISPRGTLINIMHILRDLFYWLPLRLKILSSTRRLLRQNNSKRLYDPTRKPLYVRTDAAFEIKSGGAIAHSIGVINSLKELCGNVNLVLSDTLPGIDFGEILPISYGMGRNIPGLAGQRANMQFLRHMDEQWSALDPSFIYHRYNVGNYAAALAALNHKTPLVLEYNGSEIWIARHWGGRALRDERLFLRIENAVLHSADLVVVVSQPMEDELLQRGFSRQRILVNPNGVDTQVFYPELPRKTIRDKYGLDDDIIVFGFIGSFGPWHGAEALAEAFGLLLENHANLRHRVHLLLIGDGPEMNTVKSAINRYNTDDACTLTGTIPQMQAPSYLAACDILVSPHVPNRDGTPFFGSPTKLFEYMAMGRPIIASDLDQIGEILTHRKTAYMVPPGDRDALAQGMAVLAGSADMRHKLGTAARELACSRYTWQAHTKKILDRLEELCR